MTYRTKPLSETALKASAEADVIEIKFALALNAGNLRKAAKDLQTTEITLSRRLKDLGLTAWHRETYPLSGRQPKR